MSLFVRVSTNFYTHRKTMRLRATLGDDAFWVPPRLWAYAAENQPDGDFSGYTDGEIAGLIGYSKDAPSMLQALLQAGFIDPDLHIHDWAQHNGYHASYAEKARKAAKARWEKERTKEREDTDMKGEDRKASIAPSIAPSMPQASSSIAPSIKAPLARFSPPSIEEVLLHAAKIGLPDSEAKKFFAYYGSNGWKVGKNPMKSWVSAIGGWKVRWETDRNGTTQHRQLTLAEKQMLEIQRQTERMFPDHDNH